MIIKTLATGQKLENLTHVLAALSLLVLSVCTALNLEALAEISVWRHDELYYEPDYFHKVESEGRWLNYLLSNYLPKLPGLAHIVISYFSLALFCAIAAWRTNRDLSAYKFHSFRPNSNGPQLPCQAFLCYWQHAFYATKFPKSYSSPSLVFCSLQRSVIFIFCYLYCF